MKINDQLNRTLVFSEAPTRIISLVPSLTELICDLGLETSIVGVTKFCVHPKHLRATKTIVGGTKQIHLDKIKALNPDIILCNKEENTLEIVNNCQDICPVHVSDIYTIKDVLALILHYGVLFKVEKSANALATSVEAKYDAFKKYIIQFPKVKVAYFIWRDPWMVAGNNTFITHMLNLMRFENVFNGVGRYPEISLKDEILNSVDMFLLSSEPFPFKQSHKVELMHLTKKPVFLVDGEYFSWYGSRLLKTFNYLKELRERNFFGIP